MNTEAQQAMIDLEGDRVVPGRQVLLPQQRSQAGEDLQGSSNGVSINPPKLLLTATAAGGAPSASLTPALSTALARAGTTGCLLGTHPSQG